MHFSGPTCSWVEAAGATGELAGTAAGAGAVEGAFAGAAVATGIAVGSLATGDAEAGVVDGLEGRAIDFPGAFTGPFPAGATGAAAAGTGSFAGGAGDGEGAATGAWVSGGGFVVPQPMAAKLSAPKTNEARMLVRSMRIPRK